MASSKNNANTVPISGGSVGEGIFYIISLWFRCGWCSAILNHNGLLCNIAWGWFWAFERWEVAYCSCGVYGASYNVLLERWQKPKTTGALAERWLGGRKKVSDSVPIFSLAYLISTFINHSEKRRNGFTLYLFATLIQTLLPMFSVVNFKYFTISFVEYSASNFRISVSNVSVVVAYKALGIIIALSLERLSLTRWV